MKVSITKTQWFALNDLRGLPERAQMLVNSEVSPDAGLSMGSEEEPMDPAMRARLEAVHALGKRAEEAGKPFEQIALYADLIVLCGECHATRDE